MMAYVQKILIATLLLLAMVDEYKGNEYNKGNERTPTGGSCCQTPGDQSDVRIKGKDNIEIECKKKEQGKNIVWYSYGSVQHGFDLFTYKTSGTKYTVPSRGGIFTCTTEENKTNVKSEHICNSHKTFIISPAPETPENKDNATTYVEGENVTLGCHVNSPASYALLWIATYRNGPTKCLSSVEVVKETISYNISYNKLCCPTEGIYQRYNRIHLLHYLDIDIITTSQSGEYLCIVYFYDKGAYSWKRVNERIIQVTKKDANCVTFIISKTIRGLAVVSIPLCLVTLCIKYKGKKRKVNHSHSKAPATEYECTSYAVSVGQENALHTVYANEQELLSATGTKHTDIELTTLAACSDVEYSDVDLGP